MLRSAFLVLLCAPAQLLAQTSHLSGSFGAGLTWLAGVDSELSNRHPGRTIVCGARYSVQRSRQYQLSVGFEYTDEVRTFTTPGTPLAFPESSHFYRHTLQMRLLQAPIGIDYFLSPASRFSITASGVPGINVSFEREIDEVISTVGPTGGDIVGQDQGKGAVAPGVFLKYAIGVSGRFSIGRSGFRLSIQHSNDMLPLSYSSSYPIGFPGIQMKRSYLEARLELILWRWTK